MEGECVGNRSMFAYDEKGTQPERYLGQAKFVDWKTRKQSYSCNITLLKQLRKRRGWTQVELATVAGYSDRLIRKAESGSSISVETIEILAEALSDDERTVYPNELISDPLELSKAFVAAYNYKRAELIPTIRHFLHEDVVFQFSGDPELVPFAGKHVGIEAVDKASKIFNALMVTPPGKEIKPNYLAQDNVVSLWGEEWSHPIGVPPQPVWVVNRFTYEKGLLVLFESLFDTQTGNELFAKAKAIEALKTK